MTAIDDQLILSETQATAAAELLADLRGTEAVVSAALAQRGAIHALTLAVDNLGIPARVPAISVSKMAGALRDGYRAAPSPVDHEEYIAKFVLNTLGIEATA